MGNSSPAGAGRPGLPPWVQVALASFLGLFLEMALIRWIASEIRVFSYLKNLVLVACFLGFGTGCFLHRRRIEGWRSITLLVLIVLVIRLPWPLLQEWGPGRVSVILAGLPGFMIFHAVDELRPSDMSALAFAIAWTAGLFFAIAALLIPFGQFTARAMARMSSPLAAYSVNVAASLGGILTYTAASALALPPVVWFVPVGLGVAVLSRPARTRGVVLALTLILLVSLLPADTPASPVIWSPYQKLQLHPNGWIQVNDIGYQTMQPIGALPPALAHRFVLPYAAQPSPRRVLIVGAGSGNDASAALRAGASEVVAVEIDPVIYRIGRALHPDRPYRDPRVRVVIDDARHYLRTTTESFDLIVFSHLDSHTVLSTHTNVRLDDYVHTTEAFADARRRLAPGGALFVSYFAEQPFVADRLQENLRLAFGAPPVAFEQLETTRNTTVHAVSFFAGAPEALARARTSAAVLDHAELRQRPQPDRAIPSTDDWPFLTLVSPRVPALVGLVTAVILAFSAALALHARPRGEAFDRRLFWMGAAFMLVEVHNVSRLALAFGTTWQVNAWVIAAILAVILAANGTCAQLRASGRRPGRWATAALFGTLAAAWLVPLEPLLALGSAGGAFATLLLTSPIFFAGVVFADAFADTTSPGFALGWNVLGAVGGGMTESLSYVLGIPALVLVAALFYAFALWPARRARAAVAASPAA